MKLIILNCLYSWLHIFFLIVLVFIGRSAHNGIPILNVTSTMVRKIKISVSICYSVILKNLT